MAESVCSFFLRDVISCEDVSMSYELSRANINLPRLQQRSKSKSPRNMLFLQAKEDTLNIKHTMFTVIQYTGDIAHTFTHINLIHGTPQVPGQNPLMSILCLIRAKRIKSRSSANRTSSLLPRIVRLPNWFPRRLG